MEVAEILSLKHPFGREVEASTQLLFRSFCNHLNLGQFELARACLVELGETQGLKTKPSEILARCLDISTKPERCELHELIWPILVEHASKPNASEVNVTLYKNVIQLKYLLHEWECHTELDPSEFQLIMEDFCSVCKAGSSATLKLSSLPIIKQLAQANSEPMQHLLTLFTNHHEISKQLSEVLLDISNSALPSLSCNPLDDPLIKVTLCSACLTTQELKQKYRDVLSYIIKSLHEKHCSRSAFRTAAYSNFYSCLLANPTSIEAQKLYHQSERELYHQSERELYHQSERELYHQSERELYHQSERELNTGCLTTDNQSSLDADFYYWRDQTKACVDDQLHFFTLLLNEADKHIKSHDYTTLVKHLMRPSYQPLLPLIFQIAWQQCDTSILRSRLAHAFTSCNVISPLLRDLIEQYQTVDVIAQSLTGIYQTGQGDSTGEPTAVTASQLRAIRCQSVLHALFLLVDDLTNDWSYERVVKTISASSTQSLISKQIGTDHSLPEQLSISYQCDINLFSGFHCIVTASKAMIHSRIIFDGMKFTDKPDHYKNLVMKTLNTISEHLADIRPLVLRLEILENLFCLLFTHRSDLPSQSFHLECGLLPETHSNTDDSFFSALEHITAEDEAASCMNTSSLHIPSGFVADPFFSRDLLAVINRMLQQLEIDFKASPDVDKDFSRSVHSSIDIDSINSRRTTLEQRVVEAIWRLKLVEPGLTREFDYNQTPTRPTNITTDDAVRYEHCILPSLHTKSASSQAPRVRSQRVKTSQSESPRSDDSDSSKSNNAPNKRPTLSHQRRKSRMRMTSAMSQSQSLLQNPGGVINRMLSTPADLVYMCMRRDNLTQAKEVLKLYNLSNSVIADEVSLTDDIYKARTNQSPSTVTTSPIKTRPQGELSCIRHAARITLTNMDSMDTAASLSLRANFPHAVSNLPAQKRKQYEAFFHPSLPPAMVLFDLLCSTDSSNQSWSPTQLANQLRFASLRFAEVSQNSSIPGFLGLIRNVEIMPPTALPSSSIPSHSLTTLRDYILSILFCSIDTSHFKRICEERTEVTTQYRLATNSLTSDANIDMQGLIASLNAAYPDPSSRLLYELNQQIELLQSTMKEKSTDSNQSADREVNFQSVLHDGPTMIMGRLLFEFNVPPESLTVVADMMKLNLSHVIVRSCCPPIRCKAPRSIHSPVERQKTNCSSPSGYRDCLNCDVENQADFELDPLSTVANLLSRLLAIVHTQCRTINCHEDAIAVGSQPEYAEFCRDCEKLRELDMSRLSQDLEKAACFTNIHNMLSLHGLIEYYARCAAKPQPASMMSSVLHFMSHGYQIGELGIINIFEIQQFLFGLSTRGSQLHIQLLELSIEHPWFNYIIDNGVSYIYLLYDGSLNAQPIQVLTSNNIMDKAAKARLTYLSAHVFLDKERDAIIIPQLLEDTIQNLIPGALMTESDCKHAELLSWVASPSNHKRWAELKIYITRMDASEAGKPAVVVTAYSNTLQYYTNSTEATEAIQFPADLVSQTDQSSDLEFSSSFKLTRSDTNLQQAKFTISPSAIKYLRSRSPVVTMLLDLVYEDILMSEEMDSSEEESHFSSENLLTGFPELARYIHKVIIPLCSVDKPDITGLNLQEALDEFSRLKLPDKVKFSLVSHYKSNHLKAAQDHCLEVLFRAGDYETLQASIAEYLSYLPVHEVERKKSLVALRDLVLLRMASEKVSAESISCIKQLACARLQAHVVISCLHKSRWSVEKCVQVLPLCERRLAVIGDTFLRPHLETTYERIAAFHRIMMHAQAKLDMNTENGSLNQGAIRDIASSWQSVALKLVEQPLLVFQLLHETKEFHFAKRLYDISIHDVRSAPELKRLVYSKYIVHCLDDNNDGKLAEKVILACRPDGIDWLYSLCDDVLEKVQLPSSLTSISSLILNNLLPELGESRQLQAKLMNVSCQVYSSLEARARSTCRQLLPQPELLLEQLLMNSQIARASELVKLLFEMSIQQGPCSIDAIKELLYTYAEKALDFPLIYSSSNDTEAKTLSNAIKISSKEKTTPLPIKRDQSMGVLSSSTYSSSLGRSPAFQKRPSIVPISRVVTSPAALANSSPQQTDGAHSGDSLPLQFIIPEEAPDPSEWVKDSQTDVCMVCSTERFSMFSRRHHCRRCGRVVCGGCSARTAQVKGQSSRVCDDCYNYIYSASEQKTIHISASAGSFNSLRGRSSSSLIVNTNQPGQTGNGIYSPVWLLTRSNEENQLVRDEFFYEHAPSVSLCTSILHLYGESTDCAHRMLTLCAKLSKIIKPIKPETINPEVDYNLIISMMKFLLFNAKLIFTNQHLSTGVSLCDVYSSRVELLSLLLSNYYLDLPSLDELSNIATIRLLRDRLLEDERPDIAMDISTRFGLDTTAVWTSWGLACLRIGDYTTARDKFSKILRVNPDKSSPSVSFQTVLNDIIQTIESQTQSGGVVNRNRLKSSLSWLTGNSTNRDSLAKLVPTNMSLQLDVNQAELQEMLYYMKLYGNHQMLVEFYRERGFWQKAAQYVVDKQCSNEVFIECLLLPALRSGELLTLQEQLILLDETLTMFSPYLSASFLYLSKSKQFHSLYQLQLFVKDYLRAAMGCILKLYLPNAKSYKDLAARSHYLTTALQHYQSYLDYNSPSVRSHHPSSPLPFSPDQKRVDSSLRLLKTPSEVQAYIEKTRMQIRITEHLSAGLSIHGDPVTLFSPIKDIMRLCVNVVMASDSKLSAGFEIAFLIIQMCELSYQKVYCMILEEIISCGGGSHIKEFITCIQTSGYSNPDLVDSILLHSIKQCVGKYPTPTKVIDTLIKLLHKDANKMEAHILSGKLKNAYLLAIKTDQLESVERISEEAIRTNQMAVRAICEKYLRQKRGASSN